MRTASGRHRSAALCALAGLVLATTACVGTPTAEQGDPAPSAAQTVWTQTDDVAGELVQWAAGPTPEILLTTMGSSSCPLTPSVITVSAVDTIDIDVLPAPDRDCTLDLVPTTFQAVIPEVVDRSEPTHVRLNGEEYGTLPAVDDMK